MYEISTSVRPLGLSPPISSGLVDGLNSPSPTGLIVHSIATLSRVLLALVLQLFTLAAATLTVTGNTFQSKDYSNA